MEAMVEERTLPATSPIWASCCLVICEAVCRALQVSLTTCTVAVHTHGSGEAAARKARYHAFQEQLPPGAVLFLGHHLDDQVETFFLRLLRGAGVEGLAAMPRRRTRAPSVVGSFARERVPTRT